MKTLTWDQIESALCRGVVEANNAWVARHQTEAKVVTYISAKLWDEAKYQALLRSGNFPTTFCGFPVCVVQQPGEWAVSLAIPQ